MKKIPRRWFNAACLFVLISMGVTTAKAADPMDWPNWRGPEYNSTSREVGLVDSWSPKGENLLWTREDLGTISTPIVMNGKLYVLARADEGTATEGERVVCVDAATGEDIWENKFNVFLSDVPAERVAWSSVVGDPATGRVYALGVCGLFQCMDGETGKTVWSRSMSEEYGLLSTYGGRTNVPIIFEDLVIISSVVIGWGEMAKPAHRFIAFDKNTGEVVWFNGTRPLPDDTTYSTPTLAVIDGQQLMVFGSGDGAIWGFQPRTGKDVWKYQLSRRGLNVTPLVVGNTVFSGQSEENIDDNTMGAVVAIDGTKSGDITKSGELWRVKERMVGKSSPLMIDGRLYALEDTAGLLTIDPETGEVIDRKKLGTVQRSTPLYADGKIYTCTANGRWYILKPTEKGVDILHRMRLRSTGCYGSPIVSHGRIYLPTTTALYCIGKKDHTPKLTSEPELAKEVAVDPNSKPTQLQLVPAELLIRPGDKVQYKVRLFNELGQFLSESKADFSVDGNGEISSTGEFVAGSNTGHVATTVTAKVGELTGTARVRVVPDLPWHFDFSSGEIPITWVGARYRHVPRAVDGNYMMVKITTIPKGTRSQSWMGHPELHDYTIQANVKVDGKTDKNADVGLIAQRYTLDLMGASQQVQARSWPTQLRMAKTVPFEWENGVWFTMKLKVTNKEDHALVQGKVWKRDQAEPEEWTVEAIDKSPNRNGSPGLFGNAKDAEIFIDDIRVYSNN